MSMPVISGGKVNKKQAITDIIESIALMETAIAHVVNAEGEKIQAIVGTGENCKVIATSTEELLESNDSVESLIDSIVTLESILQKKLSIICSKCCKDKDEDKEFDKPKEECKVRIPKEKYCQDDKYYYPCPPRNNGGQF